MLASLNDEPSKLSRRAVFTALSGAAGLAATLATAPPATAAGPLGGIAAALGLGGGVTPFGPVPKQGATSPSGVTTYDYLVGPGPTPNYGQVVRIEWVGYTRASADAPLVKFDSTIDRGTGPLLVKHGSGRIVQGLEEALHTTTVGSRRRVVIPPRLAYTKNGIYGPVPVDAFKRRAWVKELAQMDAATGEVVFDIAMVEAYDDDADRGYYADLEFSKAEMAEVDKRVAAMKAAAPK